MANVEIKTEGVRTFVNVDGARVGGLARCFVECNRNDLPVVSLTLLPLGGVLALSEAQVVIDDAPMPEAVERALLAYLLHKYPTQAVQIELEARADADSNPHSESPAGFLFTRHNSLHHNGGDMEPGVLYDIVVQTANDGGEYGPFGSIVGQLKDGIFYERGKYAVGKIEGRSFLINDEVVGSVAWPLIIRTDGTIFTVLAADKSD